MKNQNEHFRHNSLFYFKKGKHATQACKKICNMYDKNALSEHMDQKWLAKFLIDGNHHYGNSERIKIKKNQLNALGYVNYFKSRASSKEDQSKSPIWQDWKDILERDKNEMINLNVCCRQLDDLSNVIRQKRSEFANCEGVVFHTSLETSKIVAAGNVLNPPYSPDLAPSDFHLFRSLRNLSRGNL
ncbi:hypothetical protein WN51_04184 [Melipona quadrifasciata]|uniref:Mos1 transposase HTH domain-containing protein n=1 Tax=Melipona quadrifasciata TaxID=166423 RepID=A0A0N0BDZ4_9HYME|nr:hypothetical protein WN51_04184 [Melipona quadrifasciata]